MATKSEVKNIRVTPEEKRQIEYCAARMGMNETEVLMQGIKALIGIIEQYDKKGREEK